MPSTSLSLDDLRIFVYTQIADTGRAPTSSALATRFAIGENEAKQALAELGRRKMLVLDSAGEVWMAGPFSAVPTGFTVHGKTATWWANCAWDMLGIPACLGVGARIDARCAGSGDAVTIDVSAQHGPKEDGLVHILVPARQWYEDIGYT